MKLVYTLLTALALQTIYSPAALSFDNIQEDVVEALMREPILIGALKWDSKKQGRFCESLSKGSLDYKIEIDDVIVTIEEQQKVRFEILFNESRAKLNHSTRNGTLCVDAGFGATVQISETTAELILTPAKANSSDPKLHIPKLQIHELKIHDMHIEIEGHRKQGNMPEWVNNWLERNFNSFTTRFLQSSIAKRLTDYLAEKIEDQLQNGSLHHENTQPKIVLP